MSANFEAKKVVVEEIKEKINAAKSVVLTHYDRLTVKEVTDLRNRFREAKCEYKVYKNTGSPISTTTSTAQRRLSSAPMRRAAARSSPRL